MALVCALSGVTPEDPVLSRTGYIFEKRLIEKHIIANSKCPLSGEDLGIDDLIPIKVHKAVKPRPVAAASIPGILSLLQNEWDAIMSEVFTLRTHLDTVRNQLSHSLYQHDAACRVIARLLRERDGARAQVTQLQQQIAQAKPTTTSELVEPGISETLQNEMSELAKSLLAGRRRRNVEALPVEQVRTFHNTGSFPIHQSTNPGILCLDLDKKTGNRVVSGGMDAMVILMDLQRKKTLCKMSGHMKKVNQVLIHPTQNVILSASEDKTIRVWSCSDVENQQYKCAYTIRTHSAEVYGISVHPLGDYFVSCSRDRTWAFHELDSGRTLKTMKNLPTEYRCLCLHPDGMILGGGGADGQTHIWDMRGQELKASLSGHTGPITCVAFSENGYYLATSSEDATVRLWDLRKSLCFQTIRVSEDNAPANSVAFDYSGNYVATAGPSLAVHHFEARANTVPATVLTDHEGPVTSVAFGPNASFLVSASMDRTIKLWEPK